MFLSTDIISLTGTALSIFAFVHAFMQSKEVHTAQAVLTAARACAPAALSKRREVITFAQSIFFLHAAEHGAFLHNKQEETASRIKTDAYLLLTMIYTSVLIPLFLNDLPILPAALHI
jgi:hypothetical protein